MRNRKFKLKIKKKTLLVVDWANVYGWSKSLGWEVSPEKLIKFFDRPKIIDKRFYHGVEIGQEKSEAFKLEMEKLGFSVVSKEVKWTPVLLEKQTHFKKIIKKLFGVLDKVAKTNSEISTKLYEFRDKIKNDIIIDTDISIDENGNGKKYDLMSKVNMEIYKQIYQLVENLDADLSKLNINIGNIQSRLKKPVYRRKCDFDVEITRDVLNMIDNYDTLLLFSGDGDYYSLTMDLIKKCKKVILVFAEGHKGKEYNNIKSSLFYACSVDNLKNSIKK